MRGVPISTTEQCSFHCEARSTTIKHAQQLTACTKRMLTLHW